MLFTRGIEAGRSGSLIRYGWHKNELFRLPFKSYGAKHIPVKTKTRKCWRANIQKIIDYEYQIMTIAHFQRSIKWVEENTREVNWDYPHVLPGELEELLG